MKKASVIIPTLNRAAYLRETVHSLIKQTIPASSYEILVVDNGSTDNTKQVTATIAAENHSNCVRYIYEPEPGLLSGRHRGAIEAKGEILAFVDDDIEAVDGWLQGILEAFDDRSVHLVGGPSLPKFEVDPPLWISKYCTRENDKIICGPLSLFELNNLQVQIDPTYVWGLNYSIRKESLFSFGGFNPDTVPKRLQALQGDGETGLSLKLKAKGLGALYTHKAKVYHQVPRERLTVKYFEDRFFFQGVADSYTQIRQRGSLDSISLPEPCKALQDKSSGTIYNQYAQIIFQRIDIAYAEGFLFHQEAVRSNEALLRWVLRDNYFDYRLPDIARDFEHPGIPPSTAPQPHLRPEGVENRKIGEFVNTLMGKAKTCMQDGDFASALNHFEDIDRLFPGLKSIAPLKEHCLLQLGKKK